MRIEFLYPEIANLYGEQGSMMFLKHLFPTAEIIRTQLTEQPAFARSQVDLIFMGAASESSQELIISRLHNYSAELKQHIEAERFVLLTGNALEALGMYVEKDDGSRYDALGFFPYHAKQDLTQRLNCEYMGQACGTWAAEETVLGFKTQFSACFNAPAELAWLQNLRGFGMNSGENFEGIAYKNLLGTYLLGPMLTMNPRFVQQLAERVVSHGEVQPTDVCMDLLNDMQNAYERRLAEFQNPQTYLPV